jgi:hypothetical protein
MTKISIVVVALIAGTGFARAQDIPPRPPDPLARRPHRQLRKLPMVSATAPQRRNATNILNPALPAKLPRCKLCGPPPRQIGKARDALDGVGGAGMRPDGRAVPTLAQLSRRQSSASTASITLRSHSRIDATVAVTARKCVRPL